MAKPSRPEGSADDGSSSEQQSAAVTAAAEYLQQWAAEQQRGGAADDDESVWKYKKVRQSFLLKSWPHRMRVSGDTFKLLLSYVRTLPSGCAERTIAQARKVMTEAEEAATALAEQQQQQQQQQQTDDNDDDDDDDDDDGNAAALSARALEERRAVLLIQKTRALRLLQVLGATEGGDANEAGPGGSS